MALQFWRIKVGPESLDAIRVWRAAPLPNVSQLARYSMFHIRPTNSRRALDVARRAEPASSLPGQPVRRQEPQPDERHG